MCVYHRTLFGGLSARDCLCVCVCSLGGSLWLWSHFGLKKKKKRVCGWQGEFVWADILSVADIASHTSSIAAVEWCKCDDNELAPPRALTDSCKTTMLRNMLINQQQCTDIAQTRETNKEGRRNKNRSPWRYYVREFMWNSQSNGERARISKTNKSLFYLAIWKAFSFSFQICIWRVNLKAFDLQYAVLDVRT